MQRLAFILALMVFTGATRAQPSAGLAPSAQAWQTIKNKGQPLNGVAANTPSGRAQAIAQYIADANTLKGFYTQFPSATEADEAKRREALALLYARSLGDTSQAARCAALVAEVRRDPAIDEEHREQVAAFSDNLDVRGRTFASTGGLVQAYEKTARALQAEFPGSTTIYDSLVGIAQSSPDDRAAGIARDVLNMPASDEQKAAAQVILNRIALKGTSLVGLANATLGDGNPIAGATGAPLVVYSWSGSTPGVVAALRDIAAQAPAGTRFVGVCIDMGDLSAAHALASSAQPPPGDQIYDPMGVAGKFAGRALLTTPGLIYVSDRKGMVVSISSQLDRAGLLQALAKL